MLAICVLRTPVVRLPSPFGASSRMSSIWNSTLIGKLEDSISISWACSSACNCPALTQTR